MATIHYSLPDCDETETTAFELPGEWCVDRPIEQHQIAEECAKNHFHQHDGRESSWPVIIALHDGENGPELCRFSVEQEAEPVFYATSIQLLDERTARGAHKPEVAGH